MSAMDLFTLKSQNIIESYWNQVKPTMVVIRIVVISQFVPGLFRIYEN